MVAHSALKELKHRDHHPEPDHQHGTQPDRHGGGQEFQVLAEQRELLAQAGEINFSCHLLPQKLEVGLDGDCGAHVPLHRIDDGRR